MILSYITNSYQNGSLCTRLAACLSYWGASKLNRSVSASFLAIPVLIDWMSCHSYYQLLACSRLRSLEIVDQNLRQFSRASKLGKNTLFVASSHRSLRLKKPCEDTKILRGELIKDILWRTQRLFWYGKADTKLRTVYRVLNRIQRMTRYEKVKNIFLRNERCMYEKIFDKCFH